MRDILWYDDATLIDLKGKHCSTYLFAAWPAPGGGRIVLPVCRFALMLLSSRLDRCAMCNALYVYIPTDPPNKKVSFGETLLVDDVVARGLLPEALNPPFIHWILIHGLLLLEILMPEVWVREKIKRKEWEVASLPNCQTTNPDQWFLKLFVRVYLGNAASYHWISLLSFWHGTFSITSTTLLGLMIRSFIITRWILLQLNKQAHKTRTSASAANICAPYNIIIWRLVSDSS